jgi:hypothetical protein
MTTRKIRASNGDILQVDYVGDSLPDATTVQEVYNSGKKDIRIKSVKKLSAPKKVSTWQAVKSNALRGLTLGGSRYGESDRQAIDQWNDENPIKSFVADMVGGAGLFAVPGAGAVKLAKLAAKIPKLIKVAKVANAVKKASKVKKVITAGITGGAYSGTRANIESRDLDPENVWGNTARAAAIGVPVSMIASVGGNAISKLANKKAAKAQALIDKLGGKKNLKKITENSKKLIQSDDAAITDLLKSTKLTPEDKAVIVNKYVRLQKKSPKIVDSAVNSLKPKGKSQEEATQIMKDIIAKRYNNVNFEEPLTVNRSQSVITVDPKGKAKINVSPLDAENRHFNVASKRAAQRSPGNMGGDAVQKKTWLNNEMTTQELVGVRKELYDMQNQYKMKGHNLDAKDVGKKISEINEYIARKNPNLHKADKSFNRFKNMEKSYEEGKAFKGYQPGDVKHHDDASFVRGIFEQAKANRANNGGANSIGDFNKVLPKHLQNYFKQSRPETFGRVKQRLGRLGNEEANLKTLVSGMPEYEAGVSTHGSDIAKMITRPKRALIQTGAKAVNSLSGAYEYSPKEMAKLMYQNSGKVYKNLVKQAKPTKKGKVLDTVLQSFAKTGGRGVLNGRNFSGI